jgi:hypothetical protein
VNWALGREWPPSSSSTDESDSTRCRVNSIATASVGVGVAAGIVRVAAGCSNASSGDRRTKRVFFFGTAPSVRASGQMHYISYTEAAPSNSDLQVTLHGPVNAAHVYELPWPVQCHTAAEAVIAPCESLTDTRTERGPIDGARTPVGTTPDSHPCPIASHPTHVYYQVSCRVQSYPPWPWLMVLACRRWPAPRPCVSVIHGGQSFSPTCRIEIEIHKHSVHGAKTIRAKICTPFDAIQARPTHFPAAPALIWAEPEQREHHLAPDCGQTSPHAPDNAGMFLYVLYFCPPSFT